MARRSWWLYGTGAVLAGALLAGCGGDGDDGAAAPDGFGADAGDLEALDELFEELGQAIEEHEAGQAAGGGIEQDPDRPLLLPADVTITGDLEGTYTDNPGCDLREQLLGADDQVYEDALEIRFGWAGHTVDWTAGAPDGPRPPAVVLQVPAFTGGGVFDALVLVAAVDPLATGTAEVTIEELRREEMPTGELVVITGSFSGSYAGSVGSGQLSGGFGVCNVRAP